MQIGCWVGVVGSFVTFTTLAGIANAVFYTILGEVNARSAPDEQIGMFWTSFQLFSVVRRHAKIFPESGKRRLMWGFAISGVVVFLVFCVLGLACFGRVT